MFPVLFLSPLGDHYHFYSADERRQKETQGAAGAESGTAGSVHSTNEEPAPHPEDSARSRLCPPCLSQPLGYLEATGCPLKKHVVMET